MTLVHEAGASRRSGSFDQSTSPVARLMRMPLRAWTCGGAAAAAAPAGAASSTSSAAAATAAAAAHAAR